MNVLAVLMADVDLPHGYTGHTQHFLDTLRRGGHDVRLVGFSSRRPRHTGHEVIAPVVGRFTGLNVVRIAARELLARQTDVVVITSVGAIYNLALIALCKVAGVRIVYDCHDPIVESLSVSYRQRKRLPLMIALLRFTDFLFDRLANATFVVSPGMGKMMKARGWRSGFHYFFNTHSGADFITGKIKPSPVALPGDDILLVVYEGGLQRYVRGIEEQIEACVHATSRGASVRLWLIGNGEPDYFRSFASDKGAAGVVRIDETVDPSTLSSILERADVAVWNGITAGMPSKMFDYIAHGIPILSRNDDSDVNTMCAGFVTVYGSSPKELGDKLFELWARQGRQRGLKNRRTAAGKTFIMDLHQGSERELLRVFDEIAQKSIRRSQTSSEA